MVGLMTQQGGYTHSATMQYHVNEYYSNNQVPTIFVCFSITTLNLGHMPPISEVSDQAKLSDTHHYADGAARSAAQ